MTTLTRDRNEEKYGHYTKTRLWVTGAEGTVATETIDGPSFARSASVAWCTSTEKQPDSLLSDDCPFRGGRCYGDSLGFEVKSRVLSAWRSGGDDAVYVVLEELYRQEFGGES